MIENGQMRVGGNTIGIWFGKFIQIAGGKSAKFGAWLAGLLHSLGDNLNEWGNKIVIINTPRVVTNPSAKLYNPFTLIVNFTVDTIEKYQIVLQGDYKKEYKECENGDIKLDENQLFLIINQHKKDWFKKD